MCSQSLFSLLELYYLDLDSLIHSTANHQVKVAISDAVRATKALMLSVWQQCESAEKMKKAASSLSRKTTAMIDRLSDVERKYLKEDMGKLFCQTIALIIVE